MKKYLLQLTCLLLFPMMGMAQQDLMVSQYMFNGLLLNPAYAGTHDYSTITGLYRRQWVNMPGAPESQLLSLEGPMKKAPVGLGLMLTNDKIGVSSQTDISGQYSYRLKLRYGQLAMGLRGSMGFYRSNVADLKIWDANDAAFAVQNVSKIMPNFGVGGYYFTEQAYLGFSIPHLLNYDPNTNFSVTTTGALGLERHYYVTGGYVYKVNTHVALKPSFLVKLARSQPANLDLNINALIEETLWIGFSLRTRDSFVTIIEIQLSDNFRLGYSYDRPVSNLRQYSSGSHEIMVAYNFGNTNSLKMKNPRYF